MHWTRKIRGPFWEWTYDCDRTRRHRYIKFENTLAYTAVVVIWDAISSKRDIFSADLAKPVSDKLEDIGRRAVSDIQALIQHIEFARSSSSMTTQQRYDNCAKWASKVIKCISELQRISEEYNGNANAQEAANDLSDWFAFVNSSLIPGLCVSFENFNLTAPRLSRHLAISRSSNA